MRIHKYFEFWLLSARHWSKVKEVGCHCTQYTVGCLFIFLIQLAEKRWFFPDSTLISKIRILPNTDYEHMITVSQGQYHIWDIFGLALKSTVFFVEKTSELWKSWTKESQCQKKCGYPKYPKIYSTDLPNWPKSVGYF